LSTYVLLTYFCSIPYFMHLIYKEHSNLKPTVYTDGGTPRSVEYVCNMCQPVQGIIKGFNKIKLEVPKVYIHDYNSRVCINIEFT
jgi:hypothetical protein